MKRPMWLLASLALVAGSSACRTDTVDLTYRYIPNSKATYRMTTIAEAEWNIGGRPGSGAYEITYDITETIESVDEDSAVVAVRMKVVDLEERGLPSPGAQRRSFKLRLGSAGEKHEVIEVDGVPAADLAQDELAFINTYRPPLPLAPISLRGTWGPARQSFDLPTVSQQIVAHGRLSGLSKGTDGEVAELEYTWDGPLEATMTLPQGTARIEGDEQTTSIAEFDLSAGVLRAQDSTTVNRFDVTIQPGDGSAPRPGTVRQNISSEIALQTIES